MENVKVEGFCSVKMEKNMRDNSSKIKDMEREFSISKMEIDTKEIGRMENRKAKVFNIIIMAIGTKGSG